MHEHRHGSFRAGRDPPVIAVHRHFGLQLRGGGHRCQRHRGTGRAPRQRHPVAPRQPERAEQRSGQQQRTTGRTEHGARSSHAHTRPHRRRTPSSYPHSAGHSPVVVGRKIPGIGPAPRIGSPRRRPSRAGPEGRRTR
ncbi:hypothetical protein Y09_0948 [Brachybacterium sp. SW0106-09]|nr:hypothetical protein Y09_0948 [Brachybacterium sp. SW0106-09]